MQVWLPQPVKHTHNPYHAMYAVLRDAAAHKGIKRIVVPGMCTGCGEMSASEAVKLMKLAHDDWLVCRPPRWTAEQISAEQPTYYMNSEFKHVDAGDIVHLGY